MIVRCISNELTVEQKGVLPEEFRSSDFHVTIEREYIVFGLTINSINDQTVCLVQHISDYGHLINTPMFLFDITDKRVSKYWEIKIHSDESITFWIPSFYKEYYHDDLFEGVPEIKEDFEIMKKKIEEEYKAENS